MRKLELAMIIFCSFLLGCLVTFLITNAQLQKVTNHNSAQLSKDTALENVDSQLISLLKDSFGKVFICLELGTQCHTQVVLSGIQKESIQVGSLNERRQEFLEQQTLSSK